MRHSAFCSVLIVTVVATSCGPQANASSGGQVPLVLGPLLLRTAINYAIDRPSPPEDFAATESASDGAVFESLPPIADPSDEFVAEFPTMEPTFEDEPSFEDEPIFEDEVVEPDFAPEAISDDSTSFDNAADDPTPTPIEFVYDADVPAEPQFEPETIDDLPYEEPLAEPAQQVTGPLSTLPPTPDPFYGAVHKMLAAGEHQPLFPRHTIRPPAAPRNVDGEVSVVDVAGATIAWTDLPEIANADLLTITSERTAANVPGKVVLLVDGRALQLMVTDWQDGSVDAQLPAIALQRPTMARLYLSDATGLVVDAVDFVMLPPLAE